MKPLKKITALLAISMFVAGCSTVEGMKKDFNNAVGKSSKPTTEKVDNRVCAKHFVKSGSFFSGYQYKSYGDFNKTSEKAAYKAVFQHLASKGWNITNSDNTAGIITATQDVISGHGKTVPLNVMVRNNGKRVVRVETNFSTSGGVVASSDAVLETFCGILGSLPNK